MSKECFEHMTDRFTLFFRSHLCIGRKGFRRSYVRAAKSAKFSKTSRHSLKAFVVVVFVSHGRVQFPQTLGVHVIISPLKVKRAKDYSCHPSCYSTENTANTAPVKNLLALCFSVFHLDALVVFEWR